MIAQPGASDPQRVLVIAIVPGPRGSLLPNVLARPGVSSKRIILAQSSVHRGYSQRTVSSISFSLSLPR
jgi:hypothetical protein